MVGVTCSMISTRAVDRLNVVILLAADLPGTA
jgi:hypothetical protein